jgi:hypothetical protein
MYKLLLTSFLTFILFGCKNPSSNVDANKDSIIKLQEERINQLEKQLSNFHVVPIDTEPVIHNNNNQKQTDLFIALDYFAIGSTEEEVLAIQGQPTSIQELANSKTFFYGNSIVSFKNGIVESYYDNGNLKIKVGTKIKNSKKSNINNGGRSSSNNLNENSTTDKKAKKENEEVKYIYFTFMTTDLQIDKDPITGELKSMDHDYSEIFSISRFTYEKQQSLEFCLTKNYKEWTGKQVLLIAHVYDDRQLALMIWNNEKGRLYNHIMCSELNQFGIIAQ